MKKIYSVFSLMIVMFMAISFVSCDKDNDDNEWGSNPYAGTVWEYSDFYNDATTIIRMRFVDDKSVYYEMEVRNAGGMIIENASNPYEYRYSGNFIRFKPLKTGMANLEGVVTGNIKMELKNTSNGSVWELYKEK